LVVEVATNLQVLSNVT